MPLGTRFASLGGGSRGDVESMGGALGGAGRVKYVRVIVGWIFISVRSPTHFQGYHWGENSICTRIIEISSLQRIKSYSKDT
jgi:hypothetical protein